MHRQEPQKKLGFFKNHINHCDLVIQDIIKTTTNRVSGQDRPLEINDAYKLMFDVLKRSRGFTAFYDKYDITDEVLGTVGGFSVMTVLAIAAAVKSVFELGVMLAIKAGIGRNDGDNHGEKAILYFVATFGSIGFGILYSLKCFASLLTRTFCTLTDGWKIQKMAIGINRFSDLCTEDEPLLSTFKKQFEKEISKLEVDEDASLFAFGSEKK